MQKTKKQAFIIIFILASSLIVISNQPVVNASTPIIFSDDFENVTVNPMWVNWSNNLPVINTTYPYHGTQALTSNQDVGFYKITFNNLTDTTYIEGYFYLTALPTVADSNVRFLGITAAGDTYFELLFVVPPYGGLPQLAVNNGNGIWEVRSGIPLNIPLNQYFRLELGVHTSLDGSSWVKAWYGNSNTPQIVLENLTTTYHPSIIYAGSIHQYGCSMTVGWDYVTISSTYIFHGVSPANSFAHVYKINSVPITEIRSIKGVPIAYTQYLKGLT
jgi:hypothetical protein